MLCIFTLIEVATILQIKSMEDGYLNRTSVGTKTWICFQTVALICHGKAWEMIRTEFPSPVDQRTYFDRLTLLELINSFRLSLELIFYLIILVSVFKFAIAKCQRKSEPWTEGIQCDSLPTYHESQRHPKIDVEPPKYEDLVF